MSLRPMTAEEQKQGYAICDCGMFAFVWRSELLRWMPADYHGELCEECGTWTCAVEKLRLAEESRQRGEVPARERQREGQEAGEA